MEQSKKKTSFTTEIRNGEALANLAKRLQPVLIQPEPAPPKAEEDFFKRLNMASKLESNLGGPFIIDIQLDLRFPLYYSIYNTIRTYPALDVKCYPYVSPFTLIAYEQLILFGHLLLADIHNRPLTSSYANVFRRNNGTGDLLDKLMSAYVPSHMEPLLAQLVSVHDPNHPDLIFTPSLAAFSWSHDFGRLIPVSLILAAHNCIATTRVHNPTPEAILAQFYRTIITTVNGVNYTVSNFIGGNYTFNQANYIHANWLNQAIEEIFNPIVGRALTNRPTLKKLNITSTFFNQANQINPYVLGLAYNEVNLQTLLNLIDNLSDFTYKQNKGTKTLLQLSGEAAGITIMSHSIEPPTLPTWHRFGTSEVIPDSRTDTQYAQDIRFMEDKVLGAGALNVPTEEQCNSALTLVRNLDCTAQNEPFPAETFDASRNVYPPVLYFQPYDRSASTLNYTVTLGIKIELAEFDAVVVPVPNSWDSLIDNNSRYRQGSIPVTQLYSAIPDPATPIIISRRFLHDNDHDPIGLAIVDMTRNILPRFGNAHVVAPANMLPGFNDINPVHRPNDAFTYTASSGDYEYPTADRRFYLWSSYRYVPNPTAAIPSVHFYFSLRGMFGTAVLLQRSENPARLLPR